MGIMSIILTVVGIVLMLVHYALSAMPAVIVTGILTTVALIAAYVLGTVDMRHQSARAVSARICLIQPCSGTGCQARSLSSVPSCA